MFMLISSRSIAACFAAGMLSIAGSSGDSAWAFDGSQAAPDRFESSASILPGGSSGQPSPLFQSRGANAPSSRSARQAAPVYNNVGDAIQQGVRDYKAGEKLKAADALEYAASEGNLAAQWKLGRMYADGDGVDHDDYRAFQYFSKVADRNADISPESRFAPAVSKAFVALGAYYCDGIAGTPIKANPRRAHELFHYAAAYFADSDGQYNLGRLYLEGKLGEKDARRAAQWLNLSAEKGHVYAMAILGNLLINGADGVPRQVPKGLMWLELANSKADIKRDGWVLSMADIARQRATDEQKALAQRFLAQQVAGKK